MKNYKGMSKDELVELVEQLQNRKKYGLVWEDKPEDVVEHCKEYLPVLEEVLDKAIEKDNNKSTNLLIEGDNYHALSVLNYTHAGKVDVIYIDPPYNTGAKDWKYNNDYVDINDTYRHSKWLSMMYNRLAMSKKLLTNDGILVCAIDHNEQERLGLILEELFPNREITCVTIVHNPGGIQGYNFSYTHEYAYFVYPKKRNAIALQDRRENPDKRPLRDVSKGNHLRVNAKNCFYPIIIKGDKIIDFGDVCPDSFHPTSANIKRSDGSIEVYPIDPSGNERKWVFARQSVEKIKDQLSVEFNKKRKIYDIIRKKTLFNYKTVWYDKEYNANIYGTKVLSKIIDTKFPFPKSLYNVLECIKATAANKKDSIILDFFAGSGTTGHAVLELNKEDGGNRQFILCTNNENKIAEDVTYPRIKNVIEGYADVEGISANLRYFKTSFIKQSKVSDDTRRELVKKSTEMICVKEDTYKKLYDNKKYKIYKNNNHITGILFDLNAITEFKQKIDDSEMSSSLYIFSLSHDTFEDDFLDLSVDYTLCPIPESILEVYRKLFN